MIVILLEPIKSEIVHPDYPLFGLDLDINPTSSDLIKIDHPFPILSFSLYGAMFSFESTTGSFSGKEICQALLYAWQTPLLKQHLDELYYEVVPPEGFITLQKLFPGTRITGLYWDEKKEIYLPGLPD